jgi:hypothetical protein
LISSNTKPQAKGDEEEEEEVCIYPRSIRQKVSPNDTFLELPTDIMSSSLSSYSSASPSYTYFARDEEKVPEHIRHVIIDDSVTIIPSYAFAEHPSLTTIDIPSTVVEIGEGAFFECGALSSIIIPNSVTRIGDVAFLVCSQLTSVILPHGL